VNSGNKNAGVSLMSTSFIPLQPRLAYVKQPQTFVDKKVYPSAFV